jgi:hypothetical protein
VSDDLLKTWPRRLPGYLYVPDDDLPSFPQLRVPPEGIVFHSGSVGKALGEYTIDEPDGRCVAYHFPWFESLQAYVQTVPLNRRAYHAGKQGNHWLGVGLPGHWNKDPRREVVRLRTIQLASDLMEAFPGVLRYWCRHSDIASNRKDPGPGFKDSWMSSVGMVWRIPPGCRLVRR